MPRRSRIEDAWVPFGQPRPVLASGPGGVPSFLNNGDKSYDSGAYTARAFDASSGLGIEVDISTPINNVHWQVAYAELDSDLDSARLARWDHATGYLPSKLVAGRPKACSAGMPGSEGWDFVQRPQFQAAAEATTSVGLPRRLIDGRWYRLRVQLFPDGRCGVAADGRPVWLSTSAIGLGQPFRAVIEGRSVGTRMLVGPVQVWQGVRGDVDWRFVETRRTQ